MKQPFIGLIGVALLAGAIYFGMKMAFFVRTALRAEGSVTHVESHNATCSTSSGGRRRRSRSYPCTKFAMFVEFVTEKGEAITKEFAAGSSRGYDQPLQLAEKQAGAIVPVLYDPAQPDNVYRDTFFSIWGLPLILCGFGAIMLFASMLPPRGHIRRYRW